MADVKKVDKPEPIRCKCTNNYTWLFWLIFLGMIAYLIYYIIITIEELKEQIPDLEEGGEIIRMIVAYVGW